MKLKLDAYSSICETKIFEVNGIEATCKDFGEKFDACRDKAKPDFCGNMIFEPRISTQQVLDKYGITVDEYAEICQQLRGMLSFSLCRLCR